MARLRRPNAETGTFIEEASKLRAEERKLGPDVLVAPVTIFIAAISAMGAPVMSIVTLVRAHG